MNDFATLHYTCPNCFAQRAVNDVLFRRNAVKRGPDYRKRYFWHTLHPELPGPEDTRGLADWRSYPVAQRLLRDEIVLGVTDYNGDALQQRVCPECHYPTAHPLEHTLLLLPWSDEGVDFARGQEFLKALASGGRWQLEALQADAERVLMPYLKAADREQRSIQLPGAMNADLLARYQQAGNASVLWLDLEAPGPDGAAADLGAIDVLLRLSEVGGARGERIARPTAVFLCAEEPLPETPEQWLRETHHNLLNALNALFLRFQLFPWQKGPSATAERAAAWLVQAALDRSAPPAAEPTLTGAPETAEAPETAPDALRESAPESPHEEQPLAEPDTEEDATDD